MVTSTLVPARGITEADYQADLGHRMTQNTRRVLCLEQLWVPNLKLAKRQFSWVAPGQERDRKHNRNVALLLPRGAGKGTWESTHPPQVSLYLHVKSHQLSDSSWSLQGKTSFGSGLALPESA